MSSGARRFPRSRRHAEALPRTGLHAKPAGRCRSNTRALVCFQAAGGTLAQRNARASGLRSPPLTCCSALPARCSNAADPQITLRLLGERLPAIPRPSRHSYRSGFSFTLGAPPRAAVKLVAVSRPHCSELAVLQPRRRRRRRLRCMPAADQGRCALRCTAARALRRHFWAAVRGPSTF